MAYRKKVDPVELHRLLVAACDAEIRVRFEAEAVEHEHLKLKDMAETLNQADLCLVEAQYHLREYRQAAGEQS